MKKVINILLLICIVIQVNAQTIENESVLTIEQIMQGEQFVGTSPTNIKWSDDSKTIYFNWNPNGELLASRYKININKPKKIEKVEVEELKIISHNGDWNNDYSKKVYSKNGDIFIYNIETKTTKQVTNTLDRGVIGFCPTY